MFPPNMDRAEFAERKQICAEYLARIARVPVGKRQELMVEWAEALYDGHAHRRIGLVKSQGDILRLRADLQIYYSGTVIPLLADSRPDDFEIEAIRLALRGRESAWVAEIALRLPPEAAADENSAQGAAAGRSEDPIPATRRAQVDEYIAEVAR